MKTSSAKAKGRLLQQMFAAAMTKSMERFGLVEGDLRSVSMGASGEDIILSPAAKKLLGDLRIECKNVEKLNTTTVFWGHQAKYQGKPVILVSKRNKTTPLVTMTMDQYLRLLEADVTLTAVNTLQENTTRQ